MRVHILLLGLLAAITGCSPAAGPEATTEGPADGGATTDGGSDAAPLSKTSWAYIYATYFAPGSVGHCANATCHGVSLQGDFRCSSDAAACYAGLTATNAVLGAPLLDMTAPEKSLLLDTKHSPLVWFNAGGTMPEDTLNPNTTAAAEISAWIAAGAKAE